MADARLARHRNKQAPRPGQGGTSRNPQPHGTPRADRQDRSAVSADHQHRKIPPACASNHLRPHPPGWNQKRLKLARFLEPSRWLIAPRDPGARVPRRYLDCSLILVTTFETADTAVELIDFMSPRNDGADLVRLIRGVRGRVELRTEFILRFDYGFSVPWIERLEDSGLR